MWLDHLQQVLDERQTPVRFFFRDDDAGWADQQLFELLECFLNTRTTIDLAVIPQAINSISSPLRQWQQQAEGLICVHQHGLSHTNHQQQGKNCEFGDERDYSQQYADIKTGQAILNDYFDGKVEPIFTPPWNRCTQDTVEVLQRLEFKLLSRDITAKPLQFAGSLAELSVSIDWLKKKHNRRLNWQQLEQNICNQIDKAEKIGIMLHHQGMDQTDRLMLSLLLELLAKHPQAETQNMSSTTLAFF